MTRIILLHLLLLSVILPATAQITVEVTGPTSVNVGATHSYTAVWRNGGNTIPPPAGGTPSWTPFRGTLQSGNSTSASITWTTAGQGGIFFEYTAGSNYYFYNLQVTITAATPPTPNTTFTITPNCGSTSVTRNSNPPSGVTWYWQTTSAGTSTTLGSSATINRTTSGNLYLRARNSSNQWSTSSQFVGNISIIAEAPTAGAISGDVSVCSGVAASTITNVTSASGQGTITYQWENSTDGSSWSAISGATSNSYSPGVLSGTTYFRRRANNVCGGVYSNNSVVTVYPVLNPGVINGSKTICYNQAGGVMGSVSSATGGSGSITYQWQSSTDGNNWTNIGGATALTYTAGNLTVSTHFRRSASTSCGVGYSSSVIVTVQPTLNAGSIGGNQTICAGSTASPLTSTAGASGGDGSYMYQWESSPEGTNWSAISGATGATYAPGTLSSTRYYRRKVSSCSETKTSGVVTITVNPASSAGTLAPNVGVFLTASGTLTLSGHVGAIQKWQYRIGTGSWIDIANTGTTQNYTNITATRSYRVSVKSGVCAAVNSNEVTITIHPLPTISAASNRIVLGPVALDAGDGYASYSWKNASGEVVGTSRIYNATVAGDYTVTVTKTGVTGSGTSAPFSVIGQFEGQNLNYIVSTLVTTKDVTNEESISSLSENQADQSVQYFDGLGRPMQAVTTKGSPSGNDIVQPVYYDEFGREAVKYLPYVSGSDGRFKTDFLPKEHGQYSTSPQYIFYQSTPKVAVDMEPYAETSFEPSPLNRVVKQGAPGAAWQPDALNTYTSTDRTVKFSYESNAANEVLLWKHIDPTAQFPLGLIASGTGTTPAYYAANELIKTKTKDEQYNEVIEYKDKEGRVVLKRVQASAAASPSTTDANRDVNWASTYYVYDDFGNLACVIPPEGTRLLPTQYYQSGSNNSTKDTFLSRWAFRYTYDHRNRMVMKQVPGAQAVYMVYDNRDRLVLTQDGNQRAGGLKYWTFTKYDALNRPVLTGIYTHGTVVDQAAMQMAVNNFYPATLPATKAWFESYIGNGSGNIHGYDNKSFPQVIDANSYLTVTYYDNYSFRSSWVGDYAYVYDTLLQSLNGANYTHPSSENLLVTGQVTGTKIKVLDGGVTGGYTWLKTVNYFDTKYRLIQMLSDNYKGGTDRTSNLYDFVGKVLKTKTTHITRDVRWKDVIGLEFVGNKVRSISANWGNAGAASQEILAAGQNGWIELTTTEITTGRMIGFSDINTNAHYNTIDYAVHQGASGIMYVYENGTQRVSLGSFNPGNTIRIERNGTVITYRHFSTAGTQISTYVSTVPSTTSLMIDISFNQLGGTMENIRSSLGERSNNILRRFTYDHAGRLLETWHKLNDEPEVLLTKNEYNELGQLVTKELHSRDNGTTFSQNVDYRYNIRGWLDKINDVDSPETNDLFSLDLNYHDPSSTGGPAQYNGNISEMRWNSAGSGKQSYGYRYDNMNRLTKANYYAANHVAQNGRYNEWIGDPDTGVQGYDLNGNILKLYRHGEKDAVPQGKIDELTYHYVGNQLKVVNDAITDNINEIGFKELTEKTFNAANTDTQNEYAYDANGNMTKDDNKGITAISYNHLNLPLQVNKSVSDYILYIYDATGRKLTQQVFGATDKKTDYMGEFIYERDTLQFINHEEGRIIPAPSGNSTYQYHLKDHLGNVRLTFSEATTSTSITATFERSPSSIETTENGQFLNMNNLKKVNATMYNHTPGAGKSYSYRLSGSSGEVIGPARSMEVAAGDAVDVEVYARYLASTNTNSSVGTFLNALVGAFALSPGGSAPIDGSQAYNTFTSLFSGGAWIGSTYEDANAPKAYVNYLLFDQSFNLVDAGFDQVTEAGASAHDYLSLHVNVKQPGYLYIYLSNENPKIQDVYFDDFKITHSTLVEQSDDYYPFGLTFNSYTRENTTPQDYKYNGKELQDELGLGWFDYGARMYNPEIARWNGIDKMSDAYASYSPYAYVLNNPILNRDVNGEWTVSRHREMTLQALSTAGIGGKQAWMIAHYASVFADNPGAHGQWNNAAHPLDQISYRDDVNYTKTANSQVTDYFGTGTNYNVWHSMRSPWEKFRYDQKLPGGISPEDAMLRGMEFGWDKIFRSAEKGKLSELKTNSEGIEEFGQGMHALQDAGAHKGRHDVGLDHLRNDRFGDTSESIAITRSATLVHSIMSGDVSGFNKMYESGVKSLDLRGISGKDLLNLADKVKFQGKNLRYNWDTKQYDIK